MSLILVLLCVPPVQARPRVALVLSGGGARGMAQIGVLKQLERHGIVPDIIVGTSIGAIVGGMYASGYTATQLDSLFTSVPWDEVVAIGEATRREQLSYQQKLDNDRSLLTLRFKNFTFVVPTAVSGSTRFAALLQDVLWQSPYNTETHFDSLRIPFRAVATDLSTGTWSMIDTGNLAAAMRASASFPLRYAPYRTTGRMLVDGGLVANIPIEPALSLGADIIIVVNTVSDLLPVDELTTPWAVADQALSSAMKQRDSILLNRATIVITPQLPQHSTFDFTRIDTVIAAGEAAAAASIGALITCCRPAPSATNGTQISTVVVRGATLTQPYSVPPALHANAATIKRVEQDVVAALQASGFEFAYVRTSAYDAATATLTVDVDEGRIRDVEIDPDRPVSRSAVMNEIAFDIGDVATLAVMAQTAKNLRASDVLDAVDVTVLPASSGGVVVRVGGEDRGNQVVRAGLRVDNERNAQGSIQLAELDLFNSGITVGATLNGGARNAFFGTSITAPRILGSFWTATVSAYTSFRNVYIYAPSPEATRTRPLRLRDDAFSEDRWGLRASAGRQISRQGVMLAEFRYEDQRYRDRSQRPAPPYTALGTLKGLARWDDRDRDDFPTRGRAIDISLETSLIGLSRGVGFTKLMLSYQGTQSLSKDIALTPALLVGSADRTLPGAELFSLGGQDSFFGMREDEERGRQIVVGRLEARWRLPFRLFFDTYVSARYDLGAIWANPENIKVEKLQHGVGLTVGFDTPVGPALFSVGRRFYFLTNPNSVALGPTLAYFTVGLRL